MRLRSILLVGLVVIATGCAWPMAGQSPDRRAWGRGDTAVTPANVGSLAKGWTGAVPSAATEVVGDGNGLVTRSATTVTALDPATGTVRWATALAGTGTPGLFGDSAYVPVSDRRCAIARVDRVTGDVADRVDLGTAPQDIWAAQCVTGDVVVDGDTIIVPWKTRITLATLCGVNTIAASGLTAYGPDLSVRWFDSSSVAVCGAPPIPAHTLPRISRVGDRYVASATGEPAKVYDPSTCVDYSVCKPAVGVASSGTWVGDGSTWTSDHNSQLVNLDGGTSALRWRSTDPGTDSSRTITADPAYDDTRAFAPSGVSGAASLGVYDLAGCGQSFCGPHWKVGLSAVAAFRPSIAGDVVSVATSDKKVVLAGRTGCGSASCSALRTLTLTGTPTAPPSIVAGRILVPTSAGIETFALPA
jgi:outer membrane protein assembly factor BamB